MLWILAVLTLALVGNLTAEPRTWDLDGVQHCRATFLRSDSRQRRRITSCPQRVCPRAKLPESV